MVLLPVLCLADALRWVSKWMSLPCSVEASKHSFRTVPRAGEPARELFSDTPFCTYAGGIHSSMFPSCLFLCGLVFSQLSVPQEWLCLSV